MSGLESSIRLLLRPSDEIKFILECFKPAPDASEIGQNEARHIRIVAIITHKDEINGWEEGSIFVLKRKLHSSTNRAELEIHRIFPVYGDHFSILMAQMKPEESEIPALNQARSGFKVTIQPGHTLLGSEPLDLITYDVSGLKNVLAECRRLKELSDIVPEASSPPQTYSWLASYTTNNVYVPPLPSSFPDLRELWRPINDRLSPASAGVPGNDADDIVLIRDNWAHTRARNQCRQGRTRLKIRLGTFNVNGKMPSQDLAPWVRGSDNNQAELALLPPVNEISPLSMGEVIKDPLDIEAQTLQASHKPMRPSSSFSSMSYSSVASVNAIREPSTASTFSFSNHASAPSTFTLSSRDATQTTPEGSLDSPSESSSLSAVGLSSVEPALLEPPVVPTVSIDSQSTKHGDADVLVLGFEELDLSTEALIYSTSTTREDAWTAAVFAALGEKADSYEKVASKQLVGMLIIVIIKKNLSPCFSNIMSASVGAGILGLMGNKGGTAIRLSFTPPQSSLNALLEETSTSDHYNHNIEAPGSTVLTFVVSHLAAFDEMVDKRNADFHDLSKRLIFDSSSLTMPSGSSVGVAPAKVKEEADSTIPGGIAQSPKNSRSPVALPEKFSIFETDVLFWMGDLNYRIDLPDEDVRTLLHSEQWVDRIKILAQYDQLKTAIRTKKAFSIFFEPEINHLPTYRFSSGYSTDPLGYDIKRKPAWTDRILHTCSPLTTQVHQHTYSSNPEVTMSDHRPTSATFSVDVDLYDIHQLQATAANLYRQVQSMQEVHGSKAKLSHTSIDLGNVFYKRKTTATFTFSNCGKVPLAFRFVPTDFGDAFPDWLSASHTSGLLLPSELVEITLTAFVDSDIASRLNLGPRDLDYTLIIHTLFGRDHFIAVNAQYQYTCFANKLARLTRLPGPIRKMKSHNDLLDADRAINAPREIMRLVNWLMACTHPAEDLFIAEADPDIVDDIREHLDTTEDDFPYSHDTRERTISIAFGRTLMELLNSLPDHMVPKELHTECLAATNRDEAFEILGSFPPEAVNVWISVTAFLHYYLQNHYSDGKAEKIAATFAPVFFGFLRDDYLPPTVSSATRFISPTGLQKFILHFIQG